MNPKPELRLLTSNDQEVALQRARKRAEAKLEEREHLRLELKAREYIQVCHNVIDTLVKGQEKTHTGVEVPLDRSRVQALKAAMDGSLRLLDRVLPPLKAVEIQDSPEKQVEATRLTTSELFEMVAKANQRTIDVTPEKDDRPPWD